MKILCSGYAGYLPLKQFLKDNSLDMPRLISFDNVDLTYAIKCKATADNIRKLEAGGLLYDIEHNRIVAKIEDTTYGKIMSTYRIVEIDTTRPWTIEEYDNSTSIKYLDEVNIVDKELNYYEYI